MLLGRPGRRETFRGSVLPNVAFWNWKKISRKAAGRWPKDMLLGRQGRRETFRGSLLPNVAFWNQKKSPGKRPAGGQRTCCWAAKGAGRRLGAAYCLTLRWPKDKGAGKGFKSSLGRRDVQAARRQCQGKRPAGGQRTCCWKAKEHAAERPRESTRQMAIGHAAGPPKAPQSHFFSGALPLQMAGVGGYIYICVCIHKLYMQLLLQLYIYILYIC